MSEDAEEFDWGTLPEEEWRALAVQVKASELHLKFAVSIDRGCSATEAAAQAGYAGDRDVLKGSGHRAKQSRTVQALLALAEKRKAELALGEEPAPDREKRRRQYGKLTKARDPRVQTMALDALNKMEAEDRAMRSSEELPAPADVLKSIVSGWPIIGAVVAEYAGLEADIPGVDRVAVRAWLDAAPFEFEFLPMVTNGHTLPDAGDMAAGIEIGSE